MQFAWRPSLPNEGRKLLSKLRPEQVRSALLFTAVLALATSTMYAQGNGGSPWENAVNVLQTSFTGPIAKGLALVSIVVGGLMFAFGEGGSKRMLSGIVFGVGMAIGAVNFMAWLFPGG